MDLFGFEFSIKDVIDILLAALILYEGYLLLRRSGAANLFWGILAFVLTWFLVSFVFRLELTGALFDRVVSVGAIALIVIFQDEIRGFFYRVGSRFSPLLMRGHKQKEQDEQLITQIVRACRHLSKAKTGALIVLSDRQDVKEYTDTGEPIDARVSARLIENIFFKNSPLHDGALFIIHGRIHSAACILPVSHNADLPQHYGLRHRAALGITEKTDTTAIVVSEETGRISIARGTTLQEVTPESIALYLRSAAVQA